MRKHIIMIQGVKCSLPESFARCVDSGLWYNYADGSFHMESEIIATYRLRSCVSVI